MTVTRARPATSVQPGVVRRARRLFVKMVRRARPIPVIQQRVVRPLPSAEPAVMATTAPYPIPASTAPALARPRSAMTATPARPTSVSAARVACSRRLRGRCAVTTTPAPKMTPVAAANARARPSIAVTTTRAPPIPVMPRLVAATNPTPPAVTMVCCAQKRMPAAAALVPARPRPAPTATCAPTTNVTRRKAACLWAIQRRAPSLGPVSKARVRWANVWAAAMCRVTMPTRAQPIRVRAAPVASTHR
jgi:hypothetical protein